MSLPTNLTVIQTIEVVRTDAFSMTAQAHGVDAAEQDAIARYIAFNAADGKVIFERCGYKWRSSPWRDALHIHYLEEPSKRINLLSVDTNTSPRDPWPKKFLGKLFEKLLIAGLVEGAKKGIEHSSYWDTDESLIRVNTFSFEPHVLSRTTDFSIIITTAADILGDAMVTELEAVLSLLRRIHSRALLQLVAEITRDASASICVLGENRQELFASLANTYDGLAVIALSDEDSSALPRLLGVKLVDEEAGDTGRAASQKDNSVADLMPVIFLIAPMYYELGNRAQLQTSDTAAVNAGVLALCSAVAAAQGTNFETFDEFWNSDSSSLSVLPATRATGMTFLLSGSSLGRSLVGSQNSTAVARRQPEDATCASSSFGAPAPSSVVTAALGSAFNSFAGCWSTDSHTVRLPSTRESTVPDTRTNGTSVSFERWMNSLPLISRRRSASSQAELLITDARGDTSVFRNGQNFISTDSIEASAMNTFDEATRATHAPLDGLLEVFDKLNGKKRLKTETFFIPPQNPKEIRDGLGLSQAEFSERFCIPRSTIQNWEQERRIPDQATNAYLFVIKSRPEVVAKCIAKMHEEATSLLADESASD